MLRNIVMKLQFMDMIGYMIWGLSRPLWKKYAGSRGK